MLDKNFLILLLCISVIACNSNIKESSRAHTENILDISSYEVTLNSKPAVYIKFGENDENYCTLAVLKESAIETYSLSIKGNTSLDVEADVTCMEKDDFYTMSSNSDTFIELNSIEVNDSKVVYKLSSKLMSSKGRSYIELKDLLLEVTGASLKVLLK